MGLHFEGNSIQQASRDMMTNSSSDLLHVFTNTSNNGTTSCDSLNLSKEVKGLLIAAYVLIFLIGTIGNLVAIYVIGIKNTNQRCFDVQIVGLAVADLIASIIIPIVTIHDIYFEWRHWILMGSAGCKVLLSVDHLTMLVSSDILMLISADRLRAIGSLRKLRNTPCMVQVEILVIWIISICIVAPYMHSLDVRHGVCHNWGWTPVQMFTYYAVYVSLCCFIPAILMIGVYSKSVYILCHREIPGSDDKRFNKRRKKEFVRIMKMFCCIAVIFFTLTMPHIIVHFITSYYGTFDVATYCRNAKLLMSLQYGFYTLSHFNCVVNPFIYAKMHTNMKRSLVKHISSRWKAFTLTREISLSRLSLDSPRNTPSPVMRCTENSRLTATNFEMKEL